MMKELFSLCYSVVNEEMTRVIFRSRPFSGGRNGAPLIGQRNVRIIRTRVPVSAFHIHVWLFRYTAVDYYIYAYIWHASVTFASDGKGRNGKLSASRVNLSPFPYGGRSLSLPPSLPPSLEYSKYLFLKQWKSSMFSLHLISFIFGLLLIDEWGRGGDGKCW